MPKKKSNKEEKPNSLLLVALFLLIGIVLICIPFIGNLLGPTPPRPLTASEIHEKALGLGLIGAPPHIEERHVSISSHSHAYGRNGDIPVHIVSRTNSTESWKLVGTGTLLGKYTNHVLTAYHVFEDHAGQYGYRHIGPNEFTGNEKVVPIISVKDDEGKGSDVVISISDPTRSEFPVLTVPRSNSIPNGFDADQTYMIDTIQRDISFSTYPHRSISTFVKTKMTEAGANYVFINWVAMPAESGTSAILEGEDSNSYVVIIRGQALPKEFYDKLSEEVQQTLSWTPEKMYAVGNFIRID
ncbi:MAG: hypothetical protein HZA80_03410 [Candidatus Taylorbacteria bacterium]|nr:hypothetical protein [Candidatus Taylorbacteria bacterium]